MPGRQILQVLAQLGDKVRALAGRTLGKVQGPPLAGVVLRPGLIERLAKLAGRRRLEQGRCMRLSRLRRGAGRR